MKTFKLANNVLAAVVFLIAAVVYLKTIEPSVSFWDCGEFISSSYKLEVGHPPGAPFFMLISNLFTHFASDASGTAKMVNSMSAICSALTILFLFWTVTHLTRRLLVRKDEEITLANTVLILGCGLVGSLAYTFSDTFWFSAVEGEVYATSSLFTAVVFWLILKWEEYADRPHADRWIILIAFLMGLSIGVHLLNLLCIPAIVLVYYYRKYQNPTLKGTIYALLISFVMVVIMLYGIVQGLVEVCGWFELLFVNTLGMPYNTGVFAYVIILFGVLAWAIWETMRDKVDNTRMKLSFILSVTLLGIPFVGSGYILGILIIAALTIFMFKAKKINIKALNTILISLMVIVIGYSSFALILVRASADTPMNQNNPRDIFSLRSYLAREQYGDTPLLYGRTYVSEEKRDRNCRVVDKKETKRWLRVIKDNPEDKDKYVISPYVQSRYAMVDGTNMLFPRMWSPEAHHVTQYKIWGNVKGTPITYSQCGETKTVYRPTFGENLRFFFDYQLNFMYWRYFMWNFSGRQNDFQGSGDIMNGNWITGIKFLDEPRLGPQTNMPFDIANNKAHNVYYMLPLLLGIIGIVFQFMQKNERGIQSFWITFMLFFMTGIAIVLYLNQYPLQPRERDYAYAGSFYAFCIWIGIGVAGIAKAIEKAGLTGVMANAAASVACLLVPLQMAAQNWDDHDRSGRYIARDVGRNYLESCEPNAILFTHGDNDTFPLWYVQEVEGVRTDVRVCNTSYLQTDWYINQMKRQAYYSEPLPISWDYKEYVEGKHDVIYFYKKTDNTWPLVQGLNMAKSEEPKYKQRTYDNELIDYLPTHKLSLAVDSATVVANKVVPEMYDSLILKNMEFNFENKKAIHKVDAMMLEIVSANNWKRPIYYASTVPQDIYSYFGDYLLQTGLAMQVVPVNTKEHVLYTNTERMYDNVMNKFKWSGLDKPGLYLDETNMRMCKGQRSTYNLLANVLMQENKIDSALKVLDRCIESFPDYNVPYDRSVFPILISYLRLNQLEKAKPIGESLLNKLFTSIDWMLRLKPSFRRTVEGELQKDLHLAFDILNEFYQLDKEYAESFMPRFNSYSSQAQKTTNPQ